MALVNMKTLTREQIKSILEKHKIWLEDSSDEEAERADLQGADYRSIQCPEEGAFIAFKKCRDWKIVKLLIPEDSKRISVTSGKCRANKAVVLEITSLDEKIQYKEAVSIYDKDFVYKQGEMLEIVNFDDTRWRECAPGIHFFTTRQEAIDY